MSESLPIPVSVEAITPEYLTWALRAAGVLPEGHVSGVGVSMIGAGVGFIGSIARLSLTYDGAPSEAPATLIAKLPSTDPGSRTVGVMFGLYEREVRFYQQLAPTVGLATPRCYRADYDANGQAILLLEDLTAGRWGDQVIGSTPAEARLAVQHLARYHAQWWDSPRVAEYPWIQPGEAMLRGPLEMMYDACWQPCLARFGHLFSEDFTALLPLLGKRSLKAMDTSFAGSRTLCQGDYRPDNHFYGEPGTARELVVCDWQTPTYSPGIVDLAYIICGSLNVEARRAHEDDLLAEYHALLQEGGVKEYSLEQLHLDYRGYFAGVIASGVILGAMLPEANERGKALIDVTFRRFMAAMDDLDALTLLPEL